MLKSVPRADVMQASNDMLQKQLYAIFTIATNGLEPIFQNLEDHLKFQVELEAEGILYAAGPMWTDDEESWEGEGLVVVRASSRQAAINIAERDPMHINGAREFKVRPWLINEGSMTITLNKSSQTFTIK